MLLGICAAFIVLLAFAIYGLSELGENLCGNEIIEEIKSPDNKYKLVIFQRDCGATTGFSTQISILKSDAIHRV